MERDRKKIVRQDGVERGREEGRDGGSETQALKLWTEPLEGTSIQAIKCHQNSARCYSALVFAYFRNYRKRRNFSSVGMVARR